MKTAICITCWIFVAMKPACGQVDLFTPREPLSQQVSIAYGFMVSQNQILERISTEYPSMASEVGTAVFAFEKSAIGKGAAELENAFRMVAGNDWPTLKAKIESTTAENTRRLDLDEGAVRDYLGEVQMRARGKLPDSIRNVLLSINPAYVASPGQELADGWKQTFSTKAYPKSEGADVTISFPLSWHKRDGNQTGVVQVFRSGVGHGPIICTVFCKKVHSAGEGDATLQDMNGLFTDENLEMMARGMGRMVEARRMSIAGAPGGLIVFDSRQETLGVSNKMRTNCFTILHKKHLIQLNFIITEQFLDGVTFDEAQNLYYPTYIAIVSTLARN
jgi:hypothetical protein